MEVGSGKKVRAEGGRVLRNAVLRPEHGSRIHELTVAMTACTNQASQPPSMDGAWYMRPRP